MNLLSIDIGNWLRATIIIGIILIVVFIIIVIRLICAIFEINYNIRDIREILIIEHDNKYSNDTTEKKTERHNVNNN